MSDGINQGLDGIASVTPAGDGVIITIKGAKPVHLNTAQTMRLAQLLLMADALNKAQIDV